MAEREGATPPDLLTSEGRQALRDRPGVADILAAKRGLTIAVAAVTGGGLVAAPLLLVGTSVGWSLVAGAAVAAIIAAFFVIASVVLGRPVVPELFFGQNEPAQLDDERWETASDAAREARRRNLGGGSHGGYWIEVEAEPGKWGVEWRGQRAPRDADGGGGGGWDWFGGGGDGGGGGGNGGG